MFSKIILMTIFSIGIISCTEKNIPPTQARNDESFNGIIKIEEDCGLSIVVDSNDIVRFEKIHGATTDGPIKGQYVPVNLPDSLQKENLRIKFKSRLAYESELRICSYKGYGSNLTQIVVSEVIEQK